MPESKSTSLIDRIQQKLSITKEDMRLHHVPALKEIITDAHLDAELARIQKLKKEKQRKMGNLSRSKKSIELKYGDLILNRNSAQYVSKSSLISNKMLHSKWLRGKEHYFRD